MKAALVTVSLYDITEHAQDFMERHGVTYLYAIPQPMADFWQFWCCDGVENLPAHCSIEHGVSPEKFIGRGLSDEMAKTIGAALSPQPKVGGSQPCTWHNFAKPKGGE